MSFIIEYLGVWLPFQIKSHVQLKFKWIKSLTAFIMRKSRFTYVASIFYPILSVKFLQNNSYSIRTVIVQKLTYGMYKRYFDSLKNHCCFRTNMVQVQEPFAVLCMADILRLNTCLETGTGEQTDFSLHAFFDDFTTDLVRWFGSHEYMYQGITFENIFFKIFNSKTADIHVHWKWCFHRRRVW